MPRIPHLPLFHLSCHLASSGKGISALPSLSGTFPALFTPFAAQNGRLRHYWGHFPLFFRIREGVFCMLGKRGVRKGGIGQAKVTGVDY